MSLNLRRDGRSDDPQPTPIRPAAFRRLGDYFSDGHSDQRQLPVPPGPGLGLFGSGGLKSQYSAEDTRAQRMLLQVREDVEDLRSAVEAIANATDTLMDVNIQALLDEPDHAEGLPTRALVRALVAAAEREQALTRDLADREQRLLVLQQEI